MDQLAAALGRRARLECEVCGAASLPAGSARSAAGDRMFALARCLACGFGFVIAPRTDFDAIYDAAYYAGQGADPSVDYERELAGAPTVRIAEWDGIRATVGRLHPGPIGRWLDFGCGYGTFVRHLRAGGIDAWGHDEGVALARAAGAGIPVLDAGTLDGAEPFDVVTAIEVLEHVLDPVGVLQRIAGLLALGGLLFVTTGNAARHRSLPSWSYVVPDIHVSFFEPRTLVLAYERAGLEPVPVGYGPGTEGIVRYRVLKGLRQHEPAGWQRLVPWGPAARVVDSWVGISAQPAARRRPR